MTDVKKMTVRVRRSDFDAINDALLRYNKSAVIPMSKNRFMCFMVKLGMRLLKMKEEEPTISP